MDSNHITTFAVETLVPIYRVLLGTWKAGIQEHEALSPSSHSYCGAEPGLEPGVD